MVDTPLKLEQLCPFAPRSLPASSLLRTVPPLFLASVLSRLCFPTVLAFLPLHPKTGSHVLLKSPDRVHATSMPDAAWPVCTLPPRFSRRHVQTSVLTSFVKFRHLLGDLLTFISSVYTNLLTFTTMPFQTQQLKAVWHLLVQADAKGGCPHLSCATS